MNPLPLSNFVNNTREQAAHAANTEDAALWRWFCLLFEEGRIRWCKSAAGWLVSVDHKHLSTEQSFDEAIRNAKQQLSIAWRADRETG
ncbi:hypothetical protein PQR37_18595 [Paraburkholderia nemoris]|uniref:hypothetical protein n=1 Tax=Paraburkholderia nemoris TaxID=2793076 RepID=UPI0038B6F8C5